MAILNSFLYLFRRVRSRVPKSQCRMASSSTTKVGLKLARHPMSPCFVHPYPLFFCWWYHWSPRKYLWNSMNLCLLRLLQSPFFCSSICHQSQTMFDDATTNTWRFSSGPSQVSSEHTHWGHGGGGGGRWNQCGNWNLSGPPWHHGAGHRWANQQNSGRTHIPKLMRILAQFSMYLEGLGTWVSGDHHQLSLTSLRW